MRFIIFTLTINLIFGFVAKGQNIKINEICPNNYISYEDSYEEKGDWVEFYNGGGSSINMAGMYLTDDYANLTKFRIPTNGGSATTVSADNHLVFWFDDESYKGPTHVSFKLSGTGEFLALVASNGTTIIDSITFSELSYDVTFGRTTDGSSSWSFFPIPTPDQSNSGGGYTGIAGKAAFSMDAGFYPASIQVALTTPDPSSTIYYSLNGNEPSPTRGILYTGPVNISTTKSMRARVYKTNHVPGEVTTSTYFINRTHDLPVLSVVTDSANLWDENTGIYCFGVDDYDHFYPYYGANFWKDWKRPAHIQFFETSGAEVISQNLKLSLSGNTSRVYAQKSLNFEAEDALGKNSIPYQVFPQLPIGSFKALKVRNGGSDWSSTGIRDAYNHTLLEGAMDVDHQTFRPVVLYMNGAYWGMISLTEKIDEDFLNGRYPGIDKDSIDLLFSNAEVANGSATSYNAMISYITNNSMAVQANYNYIKTQMDVQEFVNYFQARIYYASTDWPNKNIYYWRPQDQSMKWRWVMWDTDRSDLLTTSANHPCNYTHNTLAWATTSGSVDDWAQFLLNSLLLNTEFKKQFITQYAHHMNFAFCPQRTDSVLNVFRTRYHNELPAHITRWKNSNDTMDYFTKGYYQSRAEWNTEVDTIKLFFHNRQKNMRKFIMQQFSIADTSTLTLAKNPVLGGRIEIDTFQVPANPCNLVYFDGYPVVLKAVANPGYIFTGWRSTGGSILPLTW
ncbi:MAG: CotH kinase family protein, partial [Bacteroidia bacterium]|nr:CotH kinase family protein [Bacteroidia bacterium]